MSFFLRAGPYTVQSIISVELSFDILSEYMIIVS
jgi:hypothetical protein